MKKSTIIIIVVVALLAIWGVSGYNGLVTMDENVSGQWSNVETQYQRRADLIPNLVNTVKGYASHEKETLEGVVEARSKATQMTVDANDLTPEKLAEYQKAQGAVTSALGKLLAITENYPDLKANQNFLELQAQLEGTENRINVARTNFNNAAKKFNTAIRRFPKNILAGLFGFEKRAYFEAAEGSEQAPKAIGFRYSPNCFQVMTSSNSSKVPQPPGNAITASLKSAISCLRSCIFSTSTSLVSPV